MGLGRLLNRSQRHDREVQPGAFEVLIDGAVAKWPLDYFRGGMGIPGAWRAANLIADLLGQFPWDAYRERGGMAPQKITPRPPLLEQPSPPDTRMTTISSLGLDYLWHGNAIGIYAARTPSGWPTAILPVPASQVLVRRVNEPDYPLPIGSIEYLVGRKSYAPWEVLHVKGPCKPGDLRGFGVLEAHLAGSPSKGGALDLAIEQQRQASNMANAGVPTGVLKTSDPEAGETELRAMKDGWLRSQRDRTVAAINASTEFTSLAWNPEQLQLVEARRYSLTEQELIFGLPVGWLGGMNSARQYSNIEQDAVNLLKFSLGGHLARFEQALSLAFPRGTTSKADLESLLRVDTLTRYQANALALDPQKGWMVRNEVRDVEGLEPLPDPPAPPPPTPPAEEEADEEGQTDEG